MARAAETPIRIVEVGPRDGLQNEKATVPLEAKVRFIDALSETGLAEIEVGAFVRPDRVPQMADTLEVFKAIRRKPGVTYSALVPNERGLDRALEGAAGKIAIFAAASETFSRKNINASIAESIERFRPVVTHAKKVKLPVRAYVSTAFWCPYEGKIAPAKVIDVCKRLQDLGVDELSIGDTIGKASPEDVRRLLAALLRKSDLGAYPKTSTPRGEALSGQARSPLFRLPKAGLKKLFLHFHDTYGMAVANALCAWTEFGATGFDASAGGLGGCPYAPGASGNVATEDLLYAFQASGAAVPAEPQAVAAAARTLAPHLHRPLASRLSRVQSKN